MAANRVPLLALLLSAIACALGATAIALRSDPPIAASSPHDAGADRVQALASQVAELRAEMDRIAHEPGEGSAHRQPLEGAPKSSGVSPEIVERLNALESSVSLLQRQSKGRAVGVDVPKIEPTDAADLHRVAADPSASEEQRLAALRALRGGLAGGKDPHTHEVVLAMLDLADHSTDERTRTDVYRNLHGVPDPALRESMIHALANDPSAQVRKKVAEDIDKFLPDAAVENALRQAASYDADEGVRASANRTLGGSH